MARTVIVPKDSKVLRDPTTSVLNRYLNGSVLVTTDAATEEAGDSHETSFSSGLKLNNAPPQVLDDARKLFRAGARPDEETDRELSGFVEFIGPPEKRWLDQLRGFGITVLAYHPDNSYLCFGPMSSFRVAQRQLVTSEGQPAIAGITVLTSDLKHQPEGLAEDRQDVMIVVVGGAEQRASILNQLRGVPDVEMVEGQGEDVLDDNRLRFRARLRGQGQANLLKLPRVLSVEPYHPPLPEDEAAGLIIAGLYDGAGRPSGSYLRWLQDQGLDGRGVAIGIVDGGADVSHSAFKGRAIDLTGGNKDWHATMVAGHAAGCYLDETDSNHLIYGLGTAPGAELLSQDKTGNTSALCQQTVTRSGPGGALGLVQNNSWGYETRNPMDYGSGEALFDKLVRNADPGGPRPSPLTICFSSGNSGSLGLTRPKAAKNLIVTGNSENYRPDVGHDNSDNIDEVYSGPHGSSFGNCGDGRIRPHVVAPGEWTSSANFDCHAGEDEFISPLLTWGGGSSGASPKTAGACALLIQWWRRNNSDQVPSPAMLRALIVHGAEPISTGGPVPNNRQGWGRLNLKTILDPTVPRVYSDQTVLLSSPADFREWRIVADNPAKPVKITLAWTDPPGPIGSGGSPAACPIVNKLALRAEVGGHIYRGGADQFREGWTTPDGSDSSEGTDNLQNIFLKPSIAAGGPIRVSVTARNITTNCLTGLADIPQQDFALVISNARLDTVSSPAHVVVAVDHNASSPPPPNGSTGYWSNTAGNSDRSLVGAPGPAAPSPSAGPQPAGTASASGSNGTVSPPAPSANDDAWWNQIDTSPSHSETDRHSATASPTFDPAFARSLKAGFELLAEAGHLPATLNPMSEGGAPETQFTAASVDLDQAIATLKERFATAERPCCAVIVVGGGTRVAVADIMGLRHLSFLGVLYLVSDDPEVLAFLGQRIGPGNGVHFRLAADSAELPELVRAVLAEAGGMQPVLPGKPTLETNAQGKVAHYRFGVVAADLKVVVRVRPDTSAPPVEIRLKRPNLNDFVWNRRGVSGEADVKVRGDTQHGPIQLSAKVTDSSAGTWELIVTDFGGGQQPSTISIWSLGGPRLFLSERPIESGAGSVEGIENRLLTGNSTAGVMLLQLRVPSPRVAAPGSTAAPEATRDTVVQRRRTRLDAAGQKIAEDDRQPPIPSPGLGTLIALPAPSATASIVDVPIQVVGTDANGNHFARIRRTSLVRLRPLAQWQDDLSRATPKVLYTTGRIAEVELKNGLVATMRLSRGTKSRVVAVPSAVLGRELAEFDFEALRDRTFVFGVRDGELIDVFRQLGSDKAARPTGDHGIERPLVEAAIPRSEASNTDYPMATRFVPAAAFRAGGPDRGINRVVIHITDGGSSIEGPISWFQNPASGVSAHYIVGQNGEVVQMVRDRDIAWHANSANGDSIGIEHCARAPKSQGPSDAGLVPTSLQYAASGALVRWLCEEYGIPMDRDHIQGHSEADPRTTHAGCPNAVWNWDYYMQMLTEGVSLPPPDDEAKRTRKSGLLPAGARYG